MTIWLEGNTHKRKPAFLFKHEFNLPWFDSIATFILDEGAGFDLLVQKQELCDSLLLCTPCATFWTLMWPYASSWMTSLRQRCLSMNVQSMATGASSNLACFVFFSETHLYRKHPWQPWERSRHTCWSYSVEVICPVQKYTRFPCPALQDPTRDGRKREDDRDVH